MSASVLAIQHNNHLFARIKQKEVMFKIFWTLFGTKGTVVYKKKLEFRRIWRRRYRRRFIFECWFRSEIFAWLTIVNESLRCNGYNDAGWRREWGRRWWWRWIRFGWFFLVSHINFFLYQFPLPQYIPANIPYHAIRCHSRSLFKSLNDISDF